jgi:hypothetical protein
MTHPRKREVDILQARADLEWLRARYDGGAVSAAVFVTIKRTETAIAWAEHDDWKSLADAVTGIIKKLEE